MMKRKTALRSTWQQQMTCLKIFRQRREEGFRLLFRPPPPTARKRSKMKRNRMMMVLKMHIAMILKTISKRIFQKTT
jgi:hypothetical protein